MTTTDSRYSLIDTDTEAHLASFAEEVESGLGAVPKTLPCRFLYDEMGSQLFEEICELPEYYVTRTERRILEDRADEIAKSFDEPITLAELGSGSSRKTRLLIETFLGAHGQLRYVPVDISHTMLEQTSRDLLDRYAGLEVRAVASEYQEGLQHLKVYQERPRLIVWLGSSIGNLTRDEAGLFLGGIRAAMAPRDRALVGIDLRKEAAVLEAAYDDSSGVTARFSLNLLERMNRELDAHFDTQRFEHRATYLREEGRVEIQIVSLERQQVKIGSLGLSVDFEAGEGIHTENAFKYSLAEIDTLAKTARLDVDRRWLDAAGRFSLNLLAPI